MEVDGSTVYDPSAQRPAAAVLRLAAHRAAWLGRALDAYTRVCRLVGAGLPAVERGPAWALAKASAAAILRAAGDFDDVTMIAVVDAAARWLGEPDGDDYACALLGAVTDHPTQLRIYGELLSGGDA